MPRLKAAAAALALLFLAGAIALPIHLGMDETRGILGLDVDALAGSARRAPPTLRLLAPEDGQGATTLLRVAGEAMADNATILDVQYRLDGDAWESLPRVVGGARVVPFDTTLALTPGDHVLDVRAYDGESFSLLARAAVRVGAHEAPPTVRILHPAEGQGVEQGAVVVRGTVEAATPARVVVNASGREVEATVSTRVGTRAPWSATVALPPGEHVVTARARDGLPHRVVVAAGPTPPPTLRVLAPANGSAYGSAGDPACPAACILFTGAAPGARDVLLSLDGAEALPLSAQAPGTYTRDLDGAWTLALPMARLLSGEHAATFTPVGADGVRGAPQTVTFAVRTGAGVRIAGDDAPRPTHAPLRFHLEGDRLREARWLLDGAPVGEGPDVEVSLATPGVHALTALTRDAQGRTATARLPLTALNQAPVAHLEAPSAPVAGLVRLFASGQDADGRVAAYQWSFGDGATRTTTQGETSHAYAHAGVYRVGLTVLDEHGAPSAPVEASVTVLNAGPMPAFSWTPERPTLLDSVTFTDESVDPEGTLAAARWSINGAPPVEGRTVSHRFASRGPQEVTLTVLDADGAAASVTHTVHVGNLPAAVAFRHEPEAIQTGTEVLFLDQSAKLDGTLRAWTWDFGHDCPGACPFLGGRHANGTRVLHVFPAPGTYRVNLTVTDDAGIQTSRALDVVVRDAAPTVRGVTLSPERPRGMEPVTFRAEARDPETILLDHAWDLGDGATSTDATPTHRYARGGAYPARLVVRDAAGQTAELSFLVVVQNRKPEATLEAPLPPVAQRETLLLANATDLDGRVVRYLFDADGDGAPECDGPAPRCLHTYDAPGDYVATLAVADDEGASVHTELPLTVRAAQTPAPTVAFETPASGAQVAGRALLSGAATGPRPVQKVEVQLRNATWTLSAARDPWMLATGDASWRLFLDTRAFPDGAYDVVARATDADGAVGLARIPIVVANGPRESLVALTLLDAPTAPLRADHEVRGSAWHPDGPVTVRYQIDDAPWRDAPGEPIGFTIPLPMTLGPGPHVLRVDARRGLADHRVETVAFRVADAPPALVVDEVTHLAYGLLTASGRVVGEGRVQWRLDHDVWRDLPPGPEWRLAHETFRVEGGYHSLWLRAVSLDGVEEGEPVKYRVRVINPVGKTAEDQRLLDEARRQAVDPDAVDLRREAEAQRDAPLGVAPLVAASLVAALAAASWRRRARL